MHEGRQYIQLPPSSDSDMTSTMLHMTVSKPKKRVHASIITYNVVSFNMSSANDSAKSVAGGIASKSSRLESVLKQFSKEQSAHFVCIQEPRLRKSKMARISGYVIYTAAASSTTELGIIVAVNLDLPYAHIAGVPQYFTERCIRVVHESSTVLVLRVKATYFDSYIVSAHAPHSERSDMPAWWASLDDFFFCKTAGEHKHHFGH